MSYIVSEIKDLYRVKYASLAFSTMSLLVLNIVVIISLSLDPVILSFAQEEK
jgi:hypothetical protein